MTPKRHPPFSRFVFNFHRIGMPPTLFRSHSCVYVFDDNIFVKMSARLSSVSTLIVIVSPSFSASWTNLTRRRMYIDRLSDLPAVALKTPPALSHFAGDALF